MMLYGYILAAALGLVSRDPVLNRPTPAPRPEVCLWAWQHRVGGAITHTIGMSNAPYDSRPEAWWYCDADRRWESWTLWGFHPIKAISLWELRRRAYRQTIHGRQGGGK